MHHRESASRRKSIEPSRTCRTRLLVVIQQRQPVRHGAAVLRSRERKRLGGCTHGRGNRAPNTCDRVCRLQLSLGYSGIPKIRSAIVVFFSHNRPNLILRRGEPSKARLFLIIHPTPRNRRDHFVTLRVVPLEYVGMLRNAETRVCEHRRAYDPIRSLEPCYAKLPHQRTSLASVWSVAFPPVSSAASGAPASGMSRGRKRGEKGAKKGRKNAGAEEQLTKMNF